MPRVPSGRKKILVLAFPESGGREKTSLLCKKVFHGSKEPLTPAGSGLLPSTRKGKERHGSFTRTPSYYILSRSRAQSFVALDQYMRLEATSADRKRGTLESPSVLSRGFPALGLSIVGKNIVFLKK